VYKLLYKLVLEEKHYLIETLSVKIADKMLAAFPRIHKVAVRVRKNNPPLGGVVDCVEVECIKERDEL
jgi:dihydroneopterin aldolase